MTRQRILVIPALLLGLTLASSAPASDQPAGHHLRPDGQIGPAVVERWENARREGLTKILLGMELTGASEDRKATIAQELAQLGGPDPLVSVEYVTKIVANATS